VQERTSLSDAISFSVEDKKGIMMV